MLGKEDFQAVSETSPKGSMDDQPDGRLHMFLAEWFTLDGGPIHLAYIVASHAAEAGMLLYNQKVVDPQEIRIEKLDDRTELSGLISGNAADLVAKLGRGVVATDIADYGDWSRFEEDTDG